MLIFCRIGIRSGIVLWQFIWNNPISSFHILPVVFKFCDAGTCSKEIHGDDDVDGSINLLLRSCWRNVSLLVAPFFDNQQILVESLIFRLLIIFQLSQWANCINHIFPCHRGVFKARSHLFVLHQIIELLEISFKFGN